MHRILGLAGMLLLAAAPLGAQARQDAPPGRILARIVDDETGRPIEGATVRLLESDLPDQLSNAEGRFAFVGVPLGIYEIEIRHIAYGSGSHPVNVPAGEVVEFEARLRANPIALDSLVITVKARVTRLEQVGFLRRQRSGRGHYFTGKEADAWRIRHAVQSIPRMFFTGPFGRTIMIRDWRGSCIPEIYVDGHSFGVLDGDLEQATSGLEIEAIEVYRGLETPAEFAFRAMMRPCGAIVIWTRR